MSVIGFEGFEKRLEVEFFIPSMLVDPNGKGLRNLSRSQVDEVLSAAECTIVSQLSNEHFDSYVLSESSLFVYPYKVIIKTCGTTKLLKAVPVLLEMAEKLWLEVRGCRYSRGAYIFPQEQQSPQGSFSEEVSYLNKYFGNLSCGSEAFVLGSSKDHKWHIYSASAVPNLTFNGPLYTLEMCMTELGREEAAKFYRSSCDNSKEMTESTGISKLLPNSQICDFVFDPCGYSMNGIEGTSLSTIHVTPEEGFSYASFEAMGYDSENVDLKALLGNVVMCFKPRVFSLALHANGSSRKKMGSWESSFVVKGYVCDGSTKQTLPGGSVVVYHTFRACGGGECTPQITPMPLVDAMQGRVLSDVEEKMAVSLNTEKEKQLFKVKC
ncbi:hypothetical protein GOP47_0023134 [Adiantum capillus-veneris]|uniref:S-adenosylmethionine decarboxylase proenzyme n=1 Tax=Adiantum capillus-veneris TaxID=13818 RepID=A0A9D4U7K2_ADICA|nr:hypothetical protein GOP47_0023134 [Adiantum capillus-veneris]